ncbi:signal peptidase I [Vagococcus elongatus]|uniref:Signal peptidase I n=1 Tax=Vagococcus elongatus TaxID=180344 RepID=A0A430AX15_9ENTE|nr:signal peptidase I [Vagococcus elongatus]RSU12594.1 signal peptidase I [Vagococcus elongatus]
MSKKEFISNIIWLGGLIIVLFVVRRFVMSPVAVSGDSMVPTLEDRQRVIQFKMSEIKRFDIVTFPAPDQPDQNYIKRVIGLPGDSLSFKNDELYINGEKINESYLDDVKSDMQDGVVYTAYRTSDGEMLTDFTLMDIESVRVDVIPEGKVFVLGDNRPISKDSRYIGLIDLEDITGDVKFRFWPIFIKDEDSGKLDIKIGTLD